MKQIKLKTGIMIVLSLFFLLSFGSCSSSNDSIGTDTPVNPKPSDVKVMDKSKIVDYLHLSMIFHFLKYKQMDVHYVF